MRLDPRRPPGTALCRPAGPARVPMGGSFFQAASEDFHPALASLAMLAWNAVLLRTFVSLQSARQDGFRSSLDENLTAVRQISHLQWFTGKASSNAYSAPNPGQMAGFRDEMGSPEWN